VGKFKQLFLAIVIVHSSLMATLISAGEVDVIDVKVGFNGGNNFQVITTLLHTDTGWEHYANGWEMLDERGNVIGKRVLHHPHVKEQPFSRSHTLDIPTTVNTITIRGIDSVHGIGGRKMSVKLFRKNK
jgi:hypothetical protein